MEVNIDPPFPIHTLKKRNFLESLNNYAHDWAPCFQEITRLLYE